GVPAGAPVAVWGGGSGLGGPHGNQKKLSSIATPAYGFRGPGYFTAQPFAAREFSDTGPPGGARAGPRDWRGGRRQVLTEHNLCDGGGHRESASGALSSPANCLRAHGWRAGAGYQPGEPNFAAIQEWNAAEVYQRAIAIMGRQIDGGE